MKRLGKAAGYLYENLSAARLVELALERKEGVLTSTKALRVLTGDYTGRSPNDKYVVKDPSVDENIEWGAVNQPISEKQFDRLYEKAEAYISKRELFVFDGYAGADTSHRLPIRFVTEYAWHNLFVRQLFLRPTEEELLTHKAKFIVIALPGLKAEPEVDGTRSETFICLSLEKKVVLIGGTEYAGELKKSIFTVLNYLYPFQHVFPMHCSANVGKEGDVALFFGLSGTGKTTLSTDSSRRLIGDDEHGWTDTGVFNFEGGCYAKCLGLSETTEPQIWQAIRDGAVLENVAIDLESGIADYEDRSITENTRAAYPIEHIPNALIPGVAGHPKVIIFLTADAFGVLPPISKLTKEQAIYHFLSGYTSKLSGTERGVKEPEATFSTCFGAPFLPLRPNIYADMLGDKIDKHQPNIYLVNTGWTGGSYGVGERIQLSYTRAMVSAALSGSIEQAEFTPDPIFGVLCPHAIEGVPDEILRTSQTWADRSKYEESARELADRFIRNFTKFKNVKKEIIQAGPKP